jgi:hypothetical protein
MAELPAYLRHHGMVRSALSSGAVLRTCRSGWNIPGDYSAGFSTCDGDDTLPPGIFGHSTFQYVDRADSMPS